MSAGILLLAAFGLWLMLEGLAYAIAPNLMKRFGAWLSQLPPADIRQSGLISVMIGLALLYVAVRLR